MKIKITILFFILNFMSHINCIELLCWDKSDKYELEAQKIKKFLIEKMGLDIKSEKTYTLHILNSCFKFRKKKSTVLHYAIKENLTGSGSALKILLEAGTELPQYKEEIDSIRFVIKFSTPLYELTTTQINIFCQHLEETEKEKKLLIQQTTSLPNDLIGLIFQYLNCIKWKNYNEIDRTQFDA